MINIVKDLGEKFSSLKFNNAEYSASQNLVTVKFLYNPDLIDLTQENITEIKDKLKSMLEFCDIDVKFTKCVVNETVLGTYIYMTLINNFPTLSKNLNSNDIIVECSGINAKVKIRLRPSIYDYAVKAKKEIEIVNKLTENFIAEFSVQFEKLQDDIGTNFIDDNIEFQNSIKMIDEKILYELTNKVELIGSAEYNTAIDFTTIDREMKDVVICGEIKFLEKRNYTKTAMKNGKEIKYEKTFYTFSLNNENKHINVSFFPRAKELVRAESLENNLKVAIKGYTKMYKDTLSFTADSICLCEYTKMKGKTNKKSVNEKYHTVFPEKYEDFEQSSLFDTTDTRVWEKDFVVFDTETTGLDCKTNEIIEIGAVKISKGKIISTFSTFVHPDKDIPAEITEITHITNDMVKDAPKINYILPDFYKYCYGCVLVAQNISFDMGFIDAISKKMGYEFNHEQIDTLTLARQKILGLKNFKLGTICEKLGISLQGAHRAINDVLATAKVFLKLY